MKMHFRVSTQILAVVLGSVAVLSSCGGEEPLALQVPTTEFRASATPAEGAVTEKGCTIPRTDVRAYVAIGWGSWGSFQECYEFCPAGSYAYTVALRSEATQGSGDDTAMNGIKLECYNRWSATYQGYITSHAGYWGSWLQRATTYPYVVSNPFVGGMMKIEAPQGSGDDTAANAVSLASRNGAFSQPNAQTAWGTWQNPVYCPAGSAICGVNTRVEVPQGSGDDTALNGVAFACCAF